jgi:hypothetical protein
VVTQSVINVMISVSLRRPFYAFALPMPERIVDFSALQKKTSISRSYEAKIEGQVGPLISSDP